MPRSQAVVGLEGVEQADGHVGHAAGMVQVHLVFLGNGRGRVDDALGKRIIVLAGHFAGQLQQQAVAHRDVRDDHLLGLGLCSKA